MCYAPINSKVQHPPPGQPPGHLNFWRLACSNSLPSGQESRSNAPPISTELPLLKDKFGFQSNTLHAFQRDICRNDTFKCLLKTSWQSFWLKKGDITLEQETKAFKILHPSKGTFKSPLPGHYAQSNARGMSRGVEASCRPVHNLG